MYKIVYYRGEDKTVGKENWTRFEQNLSSKEEVNNFVRREKLFDKTLFQTFIAAVDVIQDDDVVAFGRLSYSNHEDNHKSVLWEGEDLDGMLFCFSRPGTDMVRLQTPFLIGDRI